MRGEGGSFWVSVNEYSCTQGAQINFGELNPYLIYDSIPSVNAKHFSKNQGIGPPEKFKALQCVNFTFDVDKNNNILLCSKDRTAFWAQVQRQALHDSVLSRTDCMNVYFFGRDFFFVQYSTLLHLQPLRFHCADGCWDRTQDRCNWCIWRSDALTTSINLIRHQARSHPQLGQISTALGFISSALQISSAVRTIGQIRILAYLKREFQTNPTHLSQLSGVAITARKAAQDARGSSL